MIGHGLDVSSAVAVDRAFLLPPDMRAWSFGGVTDGRFLAFGVQPPASNGRPADIRHPPVQPPNKPGRYGVIDETAGTLTVHDSLAVGASTNYLTMVHGAAGASYLVRVEAIPQAPSDCATAPQTCYDWQLTAQQLPGGPATVIARSSSPADATDVPVPIASGSTIAWLDTARHGFSRIYTWGPGRAAQPISAPLPTGILSLTPSAVWVATPYNSRTLTRVALHGGRPAVHTLPASAALATVRGNEIAYRVDLSGSERGVCITSVDHPERCRRILAASDVYSLTWVSDSAVLVSTPSGYLVVPTNGAAASTTLNYLYLVHSDGSQLVMLVDVGNRQALALGHLTN